MRKLAVGDAASCLVKVTREQVLLYAELSGDTNSIHHDEDAASRSPLKVSGTVPGLLSEMMFARIFGTILPGDGAVYRSKAVEFERPVIVGRDYVATCTVTELLERHRARFEMTITEVSSGQAVVRGIAVVIHNERL